MPKVYNVLKDCVIDHDFYQCGTCYTDTKTQGDKTYIETLIRYGFIKKIVEKPKTVWDLKEGDECLKIDPAWEKGYTNIFYGEYAKNLREVGDLFLTEGEVQKEIARRKAKQILLRDTKGFKPNWNDHSQNKTLVYYDSDDKKLKIIPWSVNAFGSIYFATEEDAEVSIETHEKEWKIYLGAEE